MGREGSGLCYVLRSPRVEPRSSQSATLRMRSLNEDEEAHGDLPTPGSFARRIATSSRGFV